ncbi:MAG: hypothetical protein U5Q03_14905 [Bacteroidota bacterium]|nr:hypothetical protein [Bacteroidota bacterium]
MGELEELFHRCGSPPTNSSRTWNTRLKEGDEDERAKVEEEMSQRNFGLRSVNEPWLRKAFDQARLRPPAG